MSWLVEKCVLMERILTGTWRPSQGKATPPPPSTHRDTDKGWEMVLMTTASATVGGCRPGCWSRERPHLSFPLVMRLDSAAQRQIPRSRRRSVHTSPLSPPRQARRGAGGPGPGVSSGDLQRNSIAGTEVMSTCPLVEDGDPGHPSPHSIVSSCFWKRLLEACRPGGCSG